MVILTAVYITVALTGIFFTFRLKRSRIKPWVLVMLSAIPVINIVGLLLIRNEYKRKTHYHNQK